MRSIPVVLSLAAAVVAQEPINILPDCSSEPLASTGICDVTLSPPERAAALVKLMEPSQKLDNLVSKALGVESLGLPAYNWWSEALYGVAFAPGVSFANSPPFDAATSFPMPVLLAASFDDELVKQVGDVIGTEARAWGNAGYSGVDFWTPNVNPFRDPRWGRGSETPGEDALRASRYAASMVSGLEGDQPEKERRVVATCKHYAGNDFEDWNGTTRHDFDAQITMQDLAEYYLPPFQQCARDSKVGSLMCAYNAVNGVPACADSYLLQTILREHWNWIEHNNYVTSDCEAVLDVWQNHGYADSNAEGTAMCFDAGMDTSCEYEGSSDIPGAWEQGLLKEETVDRALLRLYEGLVRTGHFDGSDSVYKSLGWEDVNTQEAQDLALQAAVEGIVLLKNDGALPLDLSDSGSVAMIGFWADDSSKLQGGYNGNAPFLNSPVHAAEEMGLEINIAGGPVLEDGDEPDEWTEEALAAAEKSDYILYFGGLDTSAAGETKDRYTINWPEAQLALIEELSQLKKPLIVIQLGDQLDDEPLLENDSVNAIFWANWPGQDGGTAVMQLVAGDASPAGRLPVTQYPTNYTDLVPLTDMNLRPSDKLPGRTYRWYETPVLPFGYGLHYTTFEAEIKPESATLDIQQQLAGCNNTYLDTCPLPPLNVAVTNTGDRTSDYVALAFVAGEVGPKPYPIKTLATYERARGIEAGQTANVTLEWTLANIARRDETGSAVLFPGTYTILLDEPVAAEVELTLTGEEAVLDEWPAPPTAES
ncbi:hypothetical protein FQN54_006411 [Arachnomyces sp. PD_36]|nr:hypothetical protein FQN54_006411 [Arachnomyces sp. PD_36]